MSSSCFVRDEQDTECAKIAAQNSQSKTTFYDVACVKNMII